MIDFDLNPLQQEHVEAVEWLFADEPEDIDTKLYNSVRATGRSYLIGVVLFKKAFKYLGTLVPWQDHSPFKTGIENMKSIIFAIYCSQSPEFRERYEVRPDDIGFMIKYR